MSTDTTFPFDVEAARRRVGIKHALRRAGIEVPRERAINENEAALLALAALHGVTPLTWEEVRHGRTQRGMDVAEPGPEQLATPEPAREPVLEGYGAISTTTYQEGEEVEVLFPNGWRSGCTFLGYRAGEPDEDFLRLDVRLPEPGRAAKGCHPDCVRRPIADDPGGPEFYGKERP